MFPASKFVDENGMSYGVKQISNKPRFSAMPYTYDIAEGNVSNHRPWAKIGFKADVTTEQDMAPWLTGASTPALTYLWPTTALTMTIVSSNAQDGAGGSGALTVRVSYLNSAYIEKAVTVIMDGTTPVTIATDMFRVQNARVMTAGTGLAAAGNITIANGGNTYGYISATKTRMRQCIWTVPYGKTLYVTQIAFAAANLNVSQYARLTTKATYDELSGTLLQNGLFMPYNEVVLTNGAYFRELNPPTKLPEKVDLKVSAYASASAACTCSLRGWLETN